MIELIIVYIMYALSRVFSGMEDGDVSVTEKELAHCRDGNAYKIKKDTIRRKRWHSNGLIKLTLTVAAFSIAAYGFSFSTILMALSLLNLQVVIFNPIIAKTYLKQNFFYVSKTELLGIPKLSPKLWYFTNLLMTLAFIYLQI